MGYCVDSEFCSDCFDSGVGHGCGAEGVVTSCGTIYSSSWVSSSSCPHLIFALIANNTTNPINPITNTDNTINNIFIHQASPVFPPTCVHTSVGIGLISSLSYVHVSVGML